MGELSILLAIIYLVGFKLVKSEKMHKILISLGAGMIITLVFLELLPISQNYTKELLAGFVLYHLYEKFSHQKIRKKHLKKIEHYHLFGFIIEKFMSGIMLIILLSLNNLFLLIPLAVEGFASGAFFRHHIEHYKKERKLAFILALAIVIGAYLASIANLPISSISFVVGAYIYLAIRDEIPKEKDEKPLFFLLGVVIVIAFLEVLL